MFRSCLPILLVFSLLSAFASDPGQPLDCSDWVFLEPGYTCTLTLGGLGTDTPFFDRGSTVVAVDNEGRQLAFRSRNMFNECGSARQWEITVSNGADATTL